ncbi:MAG: hypothetical protein K0S74_1781 [Chlamydiales bacterium]|jgi:hypothetical protein|nr:hypothetical protein [Chlamydiales bacterium]
MIDSRENYFISKDLPSMSSHITCIIKIRAEGLDPQERNVTRSLQFSVMEIHLVGLLRNVFMQIIVPSSTSHLPDSSLVDGLRELTQENAQRWDGILHRIFGCIAVIVTLGEFFLRQRVYRRNTRFLT